VLLLAALDVGGPANNASANDVQNLHHLTPFWTLILTTGLTATSRWRVGYS